MRNSSTDELLAKRIVRIEGPITDEMTNNCMAQMLYLAHRDSTAPITLEIDTPGGSVTDSLGIIRTIDYRLLCPVHISCGETIGGTAVAIVARGARGFRVASPTTTFMFSRVQEDPRRGVDISRFNHVFAKLIAERAGRLEEEIFELIRTELHLTASAALAFGLIDRISGRPEDTRPAGLSAKLETVWGRFRRLR